MGGRVADQVVGTLESPAPPASRGRGLDREGFVRPAWPELSAGAHPQQHAPSEPGEWPHGWQYYAASASEHHFRRSVVFAGSGASDRAHLLSHSRRCARSVLRGAPTAREFEFPAAQFRTLLLERVRDCPRGAVRVRGCLGCAWDSPGGLRAVGSTTPSRWAD